MEEIKAAPPLDTKSPLTEVTKIVPEHQVNRPNSFFTKQTVVFFVGGFILLCFIVLVGLVYASVNKSWMSFKKAVIDADITGMAAPIDQPGALPGSPLYQEKLLGESLFGQLLNTPTYKYLYTLFLTQERVGETHALLSNSFRTDLQGMLPSLFQKVFAQVSVQPTKLNLQDMLTQVNEFIKNAKTIQNAIQKDLNTARQDHDVVKTMCLVDKLNQVDVSYRSLLDRQVTIRSAVTNNNQDSAQNSYAISYLLYNRVRTLYTEANNCVGTENVFNANKGTTVDIDTTIPESSSEASPVDLRNLIPPATGSGNTNPISIDDTALQTALQEYQTLENKLQSQTQSITDANLLATAALLTESQSDYFVPYKDRPQNAMGDIFHATPTVVENSLMQIIRTTEKLDPKIAAVLALNNVQNQQRNIVMLIPESTPQNLQIDLINRIRLYNKQLQIDAGAIAAFSKPITTAQQIKSQFLDTTIQFPLTAINSGYIPSADYANLIMWTANDNELVLRKLSGYNKTAFSAAIYSEKALATEELETFLLSQASPSADDLTQVMYNLLGKSSASSEIISQVESTNASVAAKLALIKNYSVLGKNVGVLGKSIHTCINNKGNALSNGPSNAPGNSPGNAPANSPANAPGNSLGNCIGNSLNNSLPNTYANIYSNHFANSYPNSFPNSYGNVYSNVYSNVYTNVYSNLYSNVYSNVYSNLYSNVYGNVPPTLVPSGTNGGGGEQNSGGTNSGGPSSYNGQGYNATGYNGTGYNATGYNGSGYNSSGYNYNGSGYNATGYNGSGYTTNTTTQTTVAPITQAPAPTSAQVIQPTSAPAPTTSSSSDPATMCTQMGHTWNGSTCI